MHQHFQIVADRKLLAKLYYYHGFYCASHPGLVIFICGLLIFLCSAPIVNFSSISTQTPSQWNESFYTNTTVRNNKPNWAKESPVASIQQIIVSVFVEPVNSSVIPELVQKAFAPAYRILRDVHEYRHRERSYDKSTTLSDHCFIIGHHDAFLFSDEGKLLPRKGCLQISPVNLWQDIESFQKDEDIMAKIYHTSNKNIVGLKENIFGVPLQSIGLFPLNVTEKCLVVRYAITTVLSQYDKNFINGFTASLHKKYPVLVATGYQEDAAQIVHIYYQGDNVIEIYHLCFTYVMVFVYVAFSVSKIEMVKSKLGLAISAVVTVVASLTMAAGLCIFFGMVPSVSSSEIFPYLVIIIGLENILVITRSIVSTPAYLPVPLRVAEGLSKEGSSITLNLTSELLLLLCGYLTFVPGVQEFCMVGGVGVLTDFFLQIVFFSTVLSIDLSRLEPQNRHQKSPQVEIDVANTFVSSIPKASATEDNVIFEKESDVDNLASKKAHSDSKALSRRVNFAYFWARTRIVQRGCMVFALLYIVFVAVNSLIATEVQDTYTRTLNETNSDITHTDNVSSEKEYISLKYSKRREISGKGSGNRNNRGSFLSNCEKSIIPCVHWKELTRFHWPRLLDLYGVNVMDRHISVLPPIRIQLMVDTQHLAKSESTLNDSLSAYYQDYSKSQRWTVPNYGVEFELVDFVKVLYIFTGIFIAVAMYLVYVLFTALPKPNKARRKVGKKQIMPAAYPVFLEGHRQKIECIDCNENVIASSCLQGVVRIWDCHSSECISILDRNRDCQIWSIKCWDTFLAAGCSNGDIEIWDYRVERLTFLYESNKSGVTHILFVKESSILVGSRIDGSIDFIKVGNQLTQTNKQVSKSLDNHRTSANIKKRVNPGLTTWQLITSSVLNDQYSCYTCCAHRKSISVLSCCKDLIISGSHDNLLKVFRAHSGVCLFTLRGHTSAVTAINTDEQCHGVVSGSFNGQLLWWCLTSGECSKFSSGHFTTISKIVSTQSRIISLDIRESLCIWDRSSRTCLQTIPQLPSGCLDLTILCSNIVVCVVMDALLMLDINNGQILRIVEIEDKSDRVFITRVVKCHGENVVVCDYGERLVVFTFVEIIEKLE